MENFAPIILFVYNRPLYTRQTIEALLLNKEASESDLFIYSDAAKNSESTQSVIATRDYIRKIKGFKSITIIERAYNWGLANNLIDGITTIINKYGKAIIVEDDIVTSPFFLQFMNEGLERYKDDIRVATIHGYMMNLQDSDTLPSAFFSTWHGCWGWATWKENWTLFNADSEYLLKEIFKRNLQSLFDINDSTRKTAMLKAQCLKEIDSWAVRWCASNILENRLCLHPSKSFVKQIGFDGAGTHCKKSNVYDVELNEFPMNWEKVQKVIEENLIAQKIIHDFNVRNWSPFDKIRWFLHKYHLEFLLVGKFLRRHRWYRQ